MNKFIRLENLREEKELTKKDLAHHLGVSASIYTRWENNKASIPTERLYQLANFYEINIDYMLGLTNERIIIKSDFDIDLNIVSKRIREIRNDFNESLRVFAKRLNTTSSTWSAYETGKVLILGSFLIEICDIGKYSADWILGRTDRKNIK